VIGQSGAVILVGDPLTLSQAEKKGEATVAQWKIPANASLTALRTVSTAEILAAEPDFFVNGAIVAKSFPNLGITVDVPGTRPSSLSLPAWRLDEKRWARRMRPNSPTSSERSTSASQVSGRPPKSVSDQSQRKVCGGPTVTCLSKT
jgi:hypothetical protein